MKKVLVIALAVATLFSCNNSNTPAVEGMVYFEGGTFTMGHDTRLPQESPAHQSKLNSYYIDKTPVTVAKFREFIHETGYKTDADKYGDSGVFNTQTSQWELRPGTNWEKPFGPDGEDAKDNHPVTHVSWNDATEYAKWAGKRLPTEAEWEFAAKSGKANYSNRFSWGNEMIVDGKYKANIWQGKDVHAVQGEDGFEFTSPVGQFGSNEAGLTDMGGNVWNWCADTYGMYDGNPQTIRKQENVKVIKGGSFFFDQYGEDSNTVTFRSQNTAETSLFNTGFRCAKDEK